MRQGRIPLTGLAQGASVSLAVQAVSTGLASSVAESAGAVTPARHARPPTGVTIDDVGDEFVTLSWTPPSDSGATSITEYLITSLPPSGEHVRSTPSATIDGLVNGQPYVFFVQAYNEVLAEPGAESFASDVAVPRTVPDEPRNLSVSVAGDRSLVATWGAPVSDGGAAVDGYLLVGVSSNGGALISGPPLGAGLRRHVMGGLVAGAEYDFTLVASNDAGDSTPADAGPVTVATLPEMPVLDGEPEVGDGEATVRWLAASLGPATGHAELLGWEVCPLPAAAPCAWVGGTATEATVSDLWNGSAYRFEVRARNVVGFGPAAATEDAVVPCSVPTAPSWVRAERTGTGELRVTWAEPWDGGCGIESFEIDVDADGIAEEFVPFVPEAEFTFEGLVPCDEYSYRVRALNPRGDGPWSRPSEPMRAPEPPEPPTNLIVIPGDGCAMVRWKAPEPEGCVPVLGYWITVTETGEPPMDPIWVPGERDCWLVPDLDNGTPYLVEVRAANEAGESGLATPFVPDPPPSGPPLTGPPNPTTPAVPTVHSVTLVPSTVAVGETTTMYVQLTGVASPGGTTVTIWTYPPGIASPVLEDHVTYCGAAMIPVQVETLQAGTVEIGAEIAESSSVQSAFLTVTGAGTGGATDCLVQLNFPDGGDITDFGTDAGAVLDCPAAAFASWILELCPADPTLECIPVDADTDSQPPGFDPIDPTLLMNGEYLLVLAALNASGGEIARAERAVTISGQQKIGHFTMSFVDMTVPAAGMPIQVVRTYDSRDKRVGDFGVGWRLGFSDVRVEKSRPLHAGWDAKVHGELGAWGVTQTCLEETWAHVVSVIFPDGKVYKFRPVLSYTGAGPQTCAWWPPGYHAWVHYVPVGTTRGTLRPIQVDTIPGNDGLDPRQVLINTGAYGSPDPAIPVLYWDLEGDDDFNHSLPYNPTSWELETEDGTVWRMEEGLGLTSVEDRNGNITEFVRGLPGTPGGIFTKHPLEDGTLSEPERVVEILYAVPEFIGAIRDRKGGFLQYCQSGSTLVRVTDRAQPVAGYCGYAEAYTAFAYTNTAHPSHVTSVTMEGPPTHGVAPLPVVNEFDDDGRLLRTCQCAAPPCDPVDECVDLSDRDLAAREQTIRDLRGNLTTIQYDERGRVTRREAGPLTNPSVWQTPEYTDDDQPLEEIDPEGVTTTYEYEDGDAGGNVTAIRVDGQLTATYAWGEHQVLESMTTPAAGGHPPAVTTFEHDAAGNLLVQTDPLGHATRYEVDGAGNVTKTINALGKETTSTWVGHRMTHSTSVSGVLTSYFYDVNGNVEDVIVRLEDSDRATRSIHDAEDRVIRTESPGGSISETDHDAYGRVREQREWVDEDPTDGTPGDWRRTQFFFDEYGRPTFTKYPDGTFTESRHDLNGNVIWSRSRTRFTSWDVDHPDGIEESDSVITQTWHDEQDRPVKTCWGDDEVLLEPHDEWEAGCTFTRYDRAGRVVWRRDERGAFTASEYDEQGRAHVSCGPFLSASEPANCDGRPLRRETLFDEAGRVREVVHADGTRTVTLHDLAGRRVAECRLLDAGTAIPTLPVEPPMSDPEVTCKAFEHDALGRVIAEIDANGKRTQFGFDEEGRLRSVTDAMNEVTEYGYNDAGNMTLQRDARGRVTRYEFEVAGRRTARRLPMLQRETSDYTLTGAVRRTTDFMGEVTLHEIDPATDRQVELQLPNDPEVVTEHGPDGQRRVVTVGSEETEYVREGGPRKLLSEIHRNGQTWLSYEHDAAGNRTSITTHDALGNPARRTTFGHDEMSRLQWICEDCSDPGGLGVAPTCPGPASCPAAKYSHDPETGRLASVEYGEITPAGSFAMHVTGEYVHDPLTGGLASITWTNAATDELLRLDYAPHLDEAGRREGVTEYRDGVLARTVTYGFDELYRLTSESVDGTPVRTFTYDEVGNRLTQWRDGEGTITYGYDANDRLVSLNGVTLFWDGNGNLLQDGDRSYGWDDQDRMTDAGTWEFTYDADGLKQTSGIVEHVVDGTFAYAQVIEDRVSGALTARYLRGMHPIRITTAAGAWWYLHDALGSTRALVSAATHEVTDTWDYEAFGEIEASTSTGANVSGNRWLFAGEERREEIELDYLRARWMAPGVGRFASRDTWEGGSRQPVRSHKYVYAGNAPVLEVDPTGYNFLSSLGAEVGSMMTRVPSFLLRLKPPQIHPLAPPLTVVPIRLVSPTDTGWSDTEIANEIKSAADYWQRIAGISIVQDATISPVKGPHDSLQFDLDDDFDSVKGDPLLNKHPGGWPARKVAIFFAGHVPGFGAGAWGETGFKSSTTVTAIALGRGRMPNTLSHEIGHAMDLDHYWGNVNNLMMYGGRGWDITSSQVLKAQRSVNLRWSVPYP